MPGPEKTFENKVKKFIKDQDGWQVKFFANRMTKKGIPDVLGCVNGYFIALEIKSNSGHPSKLQMYHCSEIRKSGGFAYVVYPSGFEKLKKIINDLNNDVFDRTLPIIIK